MGLATLLAQLALSIWEAFKPKPKAEVPPVHKPAFGDIEREEEEAMKRKRQEQPTKPDPEKKP
jgi:hypothetical protein